MQQPVIGWPADATATFGAKPLQLGHSMHKSPLFADAALARLIEGSARENYYVNTMDISAHDVKSRREGVIEGISGTEALQAVRDGQIWILIQNP